MLDVANRLIYIYVQPALRGTDGPFQTMGSTYITRKTRGFMVARKASKVLLLLCHLFMYIRPCCKESASAQGVFTVTD